MEKKDHDARKTGKGLLRLQEKETLNNQRGTKSLSLILVSDSSAYQQYKASFVIPLML